jgi:diguanylate cyclase (GGDEF)-like protein
MTLNTNEGSKAAAVTNVDQLYPFISDLQKASEIPQLWRLFLQQFQDRDELKQAELSYRAGILLESIAYNKNKNEMTRKSITTRSFPDSRQDFDYQLNKKKVVMFKRLDGYCVLMKLQFANTITTLIEENELLRLSHIFFNQVFLLLKIKNFEFHSVKDDITLAYNQNYLKLFLQNEIERSRRYGSVFSVIFFDLDNLKAINEQHGHLIGTVLLKEVAAVLRSQIRKMDLLSRFGGDEFVIVLSHADAGRAHDVCTRIQTALNNTLFLKDKQLNINITGCFGISGFPGDGNTVDELIRRADIAMYEVKRTGKDGIKIYEGDK